MTRKKHILSLLCIMLVSSSMEAQDTLRITLDSCLRYAFSHNISIQTAQLNRESAIVALNGAKMNFLPSVNASASQGWNWNDGSSRNGSYGINGSLTLFNGLNNLKNYQQARTSSEQKELMVQQAQNNISSQIISAYLTILMNNEKLSYQQEVLETSHQQQLEGELKYQVGRILESDYKLLVANYLSAQAEIDNTKYAIEQNYNNLRELLCVDSGKYIAVVQPTNDLNAANIQLDSYDSVAAQSKAALPDWQINRLNIDIARYNVDLARSSFMPSLSLNAGVGYNDGTSTSNGTTNTMNGGLNTSVTLGLNIPIFDRGNAITQYRQSKLNLRQAELDYYQDSINISSTLFDQYIETQKALNNFRKTEALADAYHSSYDVYVLKYKEGAVTTVEMLQQQDKYLSAFNDYLQNKYSFILAQKLLDIYTGKEIKL